MLVSIHSSIINLHSYLLLTVNQLDNCIAFRRKKTVGSFLRAVFQRLDGCSVPLGDTGVEISLARAGANRIRLKWTTPDHGTSSRRVIASIASAYQLTVVANALITIVLQPGTMHYNKTTCNQLINCSSNNRFIPNCS